MANREDPTGFNVTVLACLADKGDSAYDLHPLDHRNEL
jgi:hypothetical protein